MAIFAGVILENNTWLDINTKEPAGPEQKLIFAINRTLKISLFTT